MNLRLFLLERRLPAAARRHMLGRLVRATADAFRVAEPGMPDACDEGFIEAYARFTAREAERLAADPLAAAVVRDRLYAGAHGIGTSIRRWTGARTPADAARALRLVYAAIGIELQADIASRSVTVRRCAFSSVYAPEVCRLVSALDAGLFHGVTGTWNVAFTERITGGAAACRARLTEAGNQ